MIKKIYKFFGGPKIKFQINEFLKSNVIFYQNYILKKKEFYKFFNDFKNNNEGYEKIDIKLKVLVIQRMQVVWRILIFLCMHTYSANRSFMTMLL